MLTTRFKESFKTALAMTIAYGIALSMDWEKPYWAAFAVAFVSLATVGQSLNKAAMRMLGTVLAIVVSLTLIALAPQSRWLMMLLISLWVAFCTYMAGGSKRQYFWLVGAFVAVVIGVSAGPDPVNAFDTAVLRAQETGLGILVYGLVAALLWPSNSRKDFDASVTGLASIQHQLYAAYLELMAGQGSAEESQALRAKQTQIQSRFGVLLGAAETDDYEVWELRRQWRAYQHLTARLTEILERWRESFAEVNELDLPHLLPGLEAYTVEIEQRLAQIDRMLAGDARQQMPQALELPFDRDELSRLPHFQKAAVAVNRSRLQELERLTRSLFEVASDIKGFGEATQPVQAVRGAPKMHVPDADRVVSVIRIMVIAWTAFLAVIFVADLPGGWSIASMSIAIGINLVFMPQLPVTKLFMPTAWSVLLAGALYVFVMPQLSSFVGLGLMIFIWTFAIGYVFAAPQQALGRLFGLAFFVVVISVSNQQTYHFLSVANTAMMFPIVYLILAFSARFPFSMQPEAAFHRMLNRFFRSAGYLMSTMRWDIDNKPSRLNQWRKAYHVHQLASTPTKLVAWAGHIDTGRLRGNSPADVQALVNSLQVLSSRIESLVEARAQPQAELLVQELLKDFRAWRIRVQAVFEDLSRDAATGEQDAEAHRRRLEGTMHVMEQRIEQALDQATEEELAVQDGENFYRLLGAYRGVSEAMVAYAGTAGGIDWDRWREARF